jgi:S1-C subfamily serine protease
MRQPILGAAFLGILTACAATPADERVPQAATAERSLMPGTIGAVVTRTEEGVRVDSIAPDGPAARAGLRRGDLVVRCAGKPITAVRQFNQQVLDTRPGERLRLDVRRDGQPLSLQIEVVQLRTALRL